MTCSAAFHVGAQHEEHSVFLCQLEVGHLGFHVEVGELSRGLGGVEKRPYTISWIGDDRDKCEFCPNKESDLPLCGRCNRFVCRACYGDKKTWGEPCLACKGEPEGGHGA
jgi:hypothetical protein